MRNYEQNLNWSQIDFQFIIGLDLICKLEVRILTFVFLVYLC